MKRSSSSHKVRLFYLILAFVIFSLIISLIPITGFDIAISRSLQEINSQVFNQVMWFVTSLGNQPMMVFLVATATLILFFSGLRREAVISSLSAALSTLSGSFIKLLIDRPRPSAGMVKVSVWLSDKSYPSNHVLVFTVFFGFLLYLLFQKYRRNLTGVILVILLFLLIASIGISRIYLGAHWATDVFGGYLLGVIWLIATIRFYNSQHGQR